MSDTRKRNIRTGLVSMFEANKLSGIAKITVGRNPVLSSYNLGTGHRAIQITQKPPYDMMALKNAYKVDIPFRQSVDKYTELINKDGWEIVGNKEQVAYIKQRISIIELSSQTPFNAIIVDIVKSLVHYANVFIYVDRAKTLDPVPGLNLQKVGNKNPIKGLYLLPPSQLQPELETDTGKVLNWVQLTEYNKKKSFSIEDVLQITYNKEPGDVWGCPYTVTALDDIRAVRQAEENVLKLLYKSINPIIHHTIPDITGTGEGRPEDIQEAMNAWQSSSVDSCLITPPGHVVKAIGAESQAIRAEGYLDYFKKRMFAGLGVSELVMGENTQAAGNIPEYILGQMYQKAKSFQKIIADYLNLFLINTLLLEKGYDPYNDPDCAKFEWHDIEYERRIKEESHVVSMWTLNLITASEARKRLNLPEQPNWLDCYINRIQIPQVLAGSLGYNPLTESKPNPITGISSGTKPTGALKTSGTAKSVAVPTNKPKGNAPMKHSKEQINTHIESLAEKIYKNSETIKNSNPTIKELSLLLGLDEKVCEGMYKHLKNDSVDSYLYINSVINLHKEKIINSMEN